MISPGMALGVLPSGAALPVASRAVPIRPDRWLRRPRVLAAGLLAVVVLAAACGSTRDLRADPDAAPGPAASVRPPDSSAPAPATTGAAPATPPTPPTTAADAFPDRYPGMPAVVDPANLYSEVRPGNRAPATADAVFRVYVPNEASGTLTVIDPTTYRVIDTVPTGTIPQHVVPSYDLTRLYVLNNSSNTITPIDPTTGVTQPAIRVEDPYNLYFTPDGAEAIVVEEANETLTFADPVTFARKSRLEADCHGMNHLDFAIDGRYALATCEFDGTMIKVDLVNRQVVGKLKLDIAASGKTDPVKDITQPQDVRVSPDGRTFVVADLITDGVYLIDGDTFTQKGFVRTGTGAHGLYPSRGGDKLYVINRGTNIIPPVGSYKGQARGGITVLDFHTFERVIDWPFPDGGSPDMGNLTEDGRVMWLGGRYDAEVYAFDLLLGKLIARIPVGNNPHGLTVWPQPGRYSFGHTGNMR